MPTCKSTSRVGKASPYWRGVNGPKKSVPSLQSASVAPRSGATQAQFGNRIGQQLLRTLVQSLPTASQNIRSRSNCTHSFRRRLRQPSCRSLRTPERAPLPGRVPSQPNPNVKLTTGLPVRQVAGKDRKTAGASESQYAQKSIDTILKRRQENPGVKAKAREEEFDRIPPVRSVVSSPVADSPESEEKEESPAMSQVKPRSNIATSASAGASQSTSGKSSLPSSQMNSRNVSTLQSRRESQDKSPQSNFCEEPKTANFCEDAMKASETLEGDSIGKETKETVVGSNMKIFPCFRGEYPTRHRPDSFQWFQATGPGCGNIMTICDEDQQLVGETEILTSCEVTEAHFLSIDCDDDGDNTTGPPCTKCQESVSMWTNQTPSMFRCRQQQQQSQMAQQRQPQMPQQQPNMSWLGSNSQQGNSFMQQHSMQQQQQQPFIQNNQGCMQQNLKQHQYMQQPPCMQQQQPNYMPPPGCAQANMQQDQINSQFSSQMQQEHLQQKQMMQKMPFQPMQQPDPNCLTELLAQELKQQMQEAQAQIAQVQLQLNSACGATRVRKMHVLTQSGTEDPSWSPTTHFLRSLEHDAVELDDPNMLCDEGDLNDDVASCFGPCAQGSSYKQLQQQQVMTGSCPGLGMPPQSGVPFPYPYPGQPNSQQPMQLGLYPVPLSAADQSQMFQQQSCAPGHQPNPYPTQYSLMQQPQQIPGCPQQLLQQQMPGCPQQQQCPSQQRSTKPQQQKRSPCPQQQSPGQQSLSMCHFCPSCCCQRYAQMRFMMPRCWPR